MAKKVARKKATKAAKKGGGSGTGKGKGKKAAANRRHERRRIGHVGRNHASLPYKADWNPTANTGTYNEVYVFGDRLGNTPLDRIRKKELHSMRYEWDNATATLAHNSLHGLIIRCRCKPKTRHKPKGPGFTTDDDITITLEFDDGGGLPPDETEETFDEVPFDP